MHSKMVVKILPTSSTFADMFEPFWHRIFLMWISNSKVCSFGSNWQIILTFSSDTCLLLKYIAEKT